MTSIRRWTGWFFLLPAALAAAAPSDDDLKSAGKQFVSLLAREDFAGAVKTFDATMAGVMPEPKLRGVWKALAAQVGPFRTQLGVSLASARKHRIAVVACQFEKAAIDVKVVFDQAGKVTGLFFAPNTSHTKYRPPKYADPATFQERDVQVGGGEWVLGGTLALPKRGGPFAGVVLVHGSGPNDRDETLFSNKPFKDLAWGLAARGIAVLRYDKRTKVHGEKMVASAQPLTVRQETVDDSLAAVALLRKTPEIDPKRVFVLGHSLGAMLAPRIARRDAKIAGLILLAAPARPLEDLMLAQVDYLARLDGKVSAAEQQQIDKVKAAVARIKDPKLSPDSPRKGLLTGSPAYWLDLRDYRPAEAARTLPQPMLILQGGRDYQVTRKDFREWREQLAQRKNVQFKIYPDLNHLFVAGKGRSEPAEYLPPGNVAKVVIEDIARWVGAQAAPAR